MISNIFLIIFSRSNLDENFKGYLERAKTWHQMTVVAQVCIVNPFTIRKKIVILPAYFDICIFLLNANSDFQVAT